MRLARLYPSLEYEGYGNKDVAASPRRHPLAKLKLFLRTSVCSAAIRTPSGEIFRFRIRLLGEFQIDFMSGLLSDTRDSPPMHALPDHAANLASRIAADDVNAFRELFDREVAGLVRYAASLLGSREDAREVVQEGFFRLWRARERLDPASDPTRLLYAAVRNLARDRLRHRAVEERPHPYFESPHIGQAESLLIEEAEEADDLQAAVQRALEFLSERQRQIVVLRWRRQLTYEQIGAELGIAPGTASVHMQRAIAQLRQLLPRFLKS
jgi:RNA polymerase sigma-70 factor (ECF subfamily)